MEHLIVLLGLQKTKKFSLAYAAMSQYGANLMALDGKNYDEILLWYYTGVEINHAGDFF